MPFFTMKSIFEGFEENSLQDMSDFLNKTITTVLLVIFCTIVGFKSYVISPMSCYAANPPSGTKFDDYMKSYCWATETFVFTGDKTPSTDPEWENSSVKKIAYYQWVPFILCIQCALFYLPSIIWKLMCHHNHGLDLSIIMKKSKDLIDNVPESGTYEQIIGSLEDLFFVHRDYRHDLLSEVRRKIHRKCRFLIASKRLATKLSMSYIFVKMLYLLNTIGQIFVMRSFLNIDNWHMNAYEKIIQLIRTGDDWESSMYFPRVSFCRLKNVRVVGMSTNSYIAQCVLPINMLNEKVFVFLYLWFPIVALITFISLITWIIRLGTYNSQWKEVKNFLKMRQSYRKMDKLTIQKFIQQFLRSDGIFLLHMIKAHAGDVVTSSITNGLYQKYCLKYRNQDFNKDKSTDEIESLSLKLEPGGKGSARMNSRKPSAPEKQDYLL